MRRIYAQIAAVGWLSVGPFFWQLDLSKGVLAYYDFLVMAPYCILHAAVFYCFIAILLYLDEYSLLNILLLVLYYPMILLTNFPFLTFRDVYVHSAPVEAILSTGRLGYARDLLPDYWPSSFLLHALSTIVCGCDVIVANYILYFGLVLVLALVSCALARTFKRKGYLLAWACPVLLLAFLASHEYKIHSYARSGFGFMILFLFLFSFVRLAGSKGFMVQLLLSVTLTTLHPFGSLYVVIFCMAYGFLNLVHRTRDTHRAVRGAAISAIVFLGWWIFNAGPSFEYGLRNFFKAAFSSRYLETFYLAGFVTDPVPLWGFVLRNCYKYSLLMLLFVASCASVLIFFKRRSEDRRLIDALMSASGTADAFLLILSAVAFWSLYRAAIFAAFSATFSSVLLVSYLKKGKISITRRGIKYLAVLILVSLSFSNMVLTFEGNVYYGELTHPSELTSLSFLFSNTNHNLSVSSSWQTAVYAEYYTYSSSNRLLLYVNVWTIREVSQKELLLELSKTIDESDFLIAGIRDSYLFVNPLGMDPSMTRTSELLAKLGEISTSRFQCVYSNGYYSIFSKPSHV